MSIEEDNDDSPIIRCENELSTIPVDKSDMREAFDVGIIIEMSDVSVPTVEIISMIPVEFLGNRDNLGAARLAMLDTVKVGFVVETGAMKEVPKVIGLFCAVFMTSISEKLFEIEFGDPEKHSVLADVKLED